MLHRGARVRGAAAAARVEEKMDHEGSSEARTTGGLRRMHEDWKICWDEDLISEGGKS